MINSYMSFIILISYIQLLVGTPGNEPEECARDFVKTYYQYYPCGVYWYNVSDELTLETCVKVAMEVCVCVVPVTQSYIQHIVDYINL